LFAGLRVLVALTKVDEYDPAVAKDLSKVATSPATRTLMARLARDSGVPANNIFPVKNFCTEYTPEASPLVAPLVWNMMYHCLICAEAFLEDECD
jgi:hypothetical protein